MLKKIIFAASLLAIALFMVSSGVISYGQNDGGVYQGDAKSSLKKKTSLVKSTEKTTGMVETAASPEESDESIAQGSFTYDERGKAIGPDKGWEADSNYLKDMPKDYIVNLPPPTRKEMEENFRNAFKSDSMRDAVSSGSDISSPARMKELAAWAAKNSGKTAKPDAMRDAVSAGQRTGLRLLAASYHYLGLPYKLGGDGIHSTDCSMFTRMSAIRAGLEPKSFQRGAGVQYRYAEKKQYDMRLIAKGTSLSNLQPGDFVFFDWKNAFCRARYHGVGHVGLYIGPTKGKAIYIIEAGNPVKKGWRNTKYLHGHARIVKPVISRQIPE